MPIAYAIHQTNNKTFLCCNITKKELKYLCHNIKVYISDLGKNGYLVDFSTKKSNDIIKRAIEINKAPLGIAPLEPINLMRY